MEFGRRGVEWREGSRGEVEGMAGRLAGCTEFGRLDDIEVREELEGMEGCLRFRLRCLEGGRGERGGMGV